MRQNNVTTQLTKDRFLEEYSTEFVERWDELINWKARHQSEKGFFPRKLREHDARRVLDIACGTGFHTVTLSKDGFEVVGADGSSNMLQKAKENARRFGLHNIRFVQANWTDLTSAFPGEKFDAIVCLGNAFTHLFEEAERVNALEEIYSLLKDDGGAIIDQRNSDKILDQGYQSKHPSY
jgi:ubiquinone/menaquinone biosynthesis C-methylase UbiE